MKTMNYLTTAIIISTASAAPIAIFNDESLKALISRIAEPFPMACATNSEFSKRSVGATQIDCALTRRTSERDSANLVPRIAMSCNIVQRDIDTHNPEAEVTCALKNRGDTAANNIDTADATDTLGDLLGGGKCYLKRDDAGVATLTHCGCKRGDDGACVKNPPCKRGADGACINNPFCKTGDDGNCDGKGNGDGNGKCKRGADGNCVDDPFCKRGNDGNCVGGGDGYCKRGADGKCVDDPFCKRGEDGSCIGGEYCKRDDDGNCVGDCKRGDDDDCY